jgi:hypothetical protein
LATTRALEVERQFRRYLFGSPLIRSFDAFTDGLVQSGPS